MLAHLFQEGAGHDESCRGFLLVVDEDGVEVIVDLVQQGQVIVHIPAAAEGILGQEDGEVGLGAGSGRERFVVVGKTAQCQRIFQGSDQKAQQIGVRLGKLFRAQGLKGRQGILGFCLSAQGAFGIITGQHGFIVAEAEIAGIGQCVVHAQSVGFHLVGEQPGRNTVELLLVPPKREKENDHAGKGRQENNAEEHLPE